MKFRELFEGDKYKCVYKKIDELLKKGFFEKSKRKALYKLVVDEYLDMGDDPCDATKQDIVEIYGASY
jgi:hypothetical protein